MYTYRCPGCGKHHTVDSDFKQDFESTCLRCGVVIPVTAELIQQSQSPAQPSRPPSAREEKITKSPAAKTIGAKRQENPIDESVEDQIDLDVDLTPLLEEEPDAQPRENSRKKKKQRQERQDDKPRKKKPQRRESPEEDIEDEEEYEEFEVAAAPEKKPLPPRKVPGEAKSSGRRWRIIAPVAVVVVTLCAAGGFLMFSGKKPESKPAARAAAKPSTKKTTTKAPPPKKEPPPPPKSVPTTRHLALSAARLSDELAANTGLANAKYTGKVLDVSGLFKQIQSKEGLHPPTRPHVLFKVSGGGVFCDLQGSFTALASWSQLRPDSPITVRGTYERDGYLRDCLLMPYTPTPDNNYRDKLVEVVGHVAEVLPTNALHFPLVRLEGDTDSVVELRCLFRQTEAEEVSKIHVGSLLTIQGKCGGWRKEVGGEYVRLDNCQLIYTSAPSEAGSGLNPSTMIRKLVNPFSESDSVPRLEAARMLREYEEDRHPYYLPPPGQEESIDTPLEIRPLAKEYSTDPKAFEKKYRFRILRIAGKVLPQRGERVVYLGSGDTDLGFRVECHFTQSEFEFLRQRREAEYRIRGLHTVMSDDHTLRLDNCQLDVPRRKGLVVTPDFLPHKPGNSFTIDVADYGVLVNNKLTDVVRREVHVQGKGGLTEVGVTHMSKFTGKRLFQEGAQEQWVQDRKGRMLLRPETSGIYIQRVNAGFIEIGTPRPGQDGGKPEIDWAPVLKQAAKAGDKWKWDAPAGAHEYVLEKFDDFRGHPCAVVRELFTSGADVLHPIEIVHVYAKELGEVERREWRQLDQRGGKKLLGEMRWVQTFQLERGSGSKAAGAKPSVAAPTPPDNKTSAPRKK